MEKLNVHQRINFKSHFPPANFERIKRVDHYGHYAQSNSTYKSFEIPFWQELQSMKEDRFITFLNKY